MSNYKAQFRNKKTGEVEDVMCWDNYFGIHCYGYGVPDESKVLTEGEFQRKYDRVDEQQS